MANPNAQKHELIEDVRAKRFKDTLGKELLRSDLKRLINDPKSSDVKFTCSDGVSVHAWRALLANRSKVFESMLQNGMLESSLLEIPLPSFSSAVMLSILEYLYTSTIECYLPVSWEMAFELIGAAHFFMVPPVESIAQEFLRTQALVVSKKTRSAVMLSTALEFEEESEEKDALLLQLADRIRHDWFEGDCARKVSEKAVNYILSRSTRDFSGSLQCNTGSLENYLTFRKIILWHFHQDVSQSCDVRARRRMLNALPGKDSTAFWNKASMTDHDIVDFVSNIPMSWNLHGSPTVLGASLQQVLEKNVSLRRIPASLLMKVIYPLQVVPPQEVLKAVVHQAGQRFVLALEPDYLWKHGAFLKIGRRGHVICNKEGELTNGTAIAFLGEDCDRVLKWSWKIIDDDAGEIQLGFICHNVDHAFEADETLDEDLESMPSRRVLCVKNVSQSASSSKTDRNSSSDKFVVELKVGLEVFFELSKKKRICRVYGESFKAVWAVWEDLPRGLYHPAVSFSYSNCASVQLRLGKEKNFD